MVKQEYDFPPDLMKSVSDALSRSPVVMLAGPRQCGKTTLAPQFVPVDDLNYFDLEDPVSLTRLDEPMYDIWRLYKVDLQDRPLRIGCGRAL